MPFPLDDQALITTAVRLHVVAMFLGMGIAAVADIVGLGILVGKVRVPPRLLSWLHHVIVAALITLLFSGGMLIVLRSGGWCGLDDAYVVRFASVCVPNKLLAKLVLMTGLGCVALLVDTFLLPLSRRIERPLLPHLNFVEIIRAGAIGTASLTCWSAIATIALVKPLHAWPALSLLACSVVAWVVLATGGCIALLVLRQALATGRRETGLAQALASVVAARGSLASLRSAAVIHRSRPGAPSAPTEPEPMTLADALAACRRAILGTAALSLVINVLMLAGPLHMLQIYDRVLTSRNVETLAVLTALLVGVYSFMGFLDAVRGRILARVALRLDRLLAPQLFTRYVEDTAPRRNGTAYQPLRDLETIRQFIGGPIPGSFFDLPWTPLYLLLIFLLHPLLGIVATVGAAVLVGLSLSTQIVTHRPLHQAADESAKTHSLVEIARRNSETLRSMAMVGAHRDRWLAAHRAALSRQINAGDATTGFTSATKIGRLLLQSLILGMGAYLALSDAMSPGAMIAASIVTTRALAPVEQLIAQWRGVLGAWGAFQRCGESLRQLVPRKAHLTLPDPTGHLEVSKLYIAIPGRTEPVLKGLSFSLKPGDALAVIGPSAAGKSTLAKALVGLCPPRHGEIRLDGASLSQWDPEQLGRHIGYLPQDVALIDGTVAQNIARLDPSPDPKAVLAAANAANVHQTILRLENGYQTEVGDNGSALSGGQRQRIGLARALYGAPALIVLDEPNANLDAAGETALAAAIKRARAAGRTLIIMAHRQSILRCVNRVLVVNDGRQVAFGETSQILRRIVKSPEQADAGLISTRKARDAS